MHRSSSTNDATRVLWELLHLPLNMSTVLVGSTLKIFAVAKEGMPPPSLDRYMLTGSMAVGSLVTICHVSTRRIATALAVQPKQRL